MNDLEGFEQLIRGFDHVAQKLEQGEVDKAAKKGAAIVLQRVKTQAPRRTGTLREGLILHKERARYKGKAVYDVYPDPKKNAIFQKPIKNQVRSRTKYGYYPASQEYGFFTRRPDGGMTYTRPSGEKMHMDKVPGKHYMRAGAEAAEEAATKVMVQSLLESIGKELGG